MTMTDPTTSRKLLTELPGPKSLALHERRKKVVSAGLTQGFPIYIASAEGAILTDVDGNHILDLGSGIAVTSIGHAVPAVTEAVSRQVADFTHTCFMVTPYEEYIEVCEQLAELTPGDFPKTSVLLNSGAEAVENAVKIARLATGKPAIVVVDHAYHGRTNLTMALTAKNMPYKDRFGPFAPEVYRVSTSYPLRDGLSGPEAAAKTIAEIESLVGVHNLAAVLIEPIQGEGVFIVPAPGFLKGLADWTQANGALFIADEIQAGFCRTGEWFAVNHEGVVPDMITTAKGMAGGMPLAAVTGRADIMNATHEGGLGGTYGGNPVAAAAALATIRTMREQDLVGKARHIESIALPFLQELKATFPIIADVRGRGAMLALEFCEPGTVIRLLPPLVITDDQLREGLTMLAEAIASI